MYNDKAVSAASLYGGVTQLVEYPVHTRPVTCSSQVAATRPVGQAVKTPPFHGGNMGSIPVRVTKKERHPFGCLSFFMVCAGIERPLKKTCRWHVFRPWEIPLIFGRIPQGCGQKSEITTPCKNTSFHTELLIDNFCGIAAMYNFQQTTLGLQSLQVEGLVVYGVSLRIIIAM